MSDRLKTERTKLTDSEADALSTLAHIAVTTVPTLTIHGSHASALLAYMSRLEIERNELRTELTASEKRERTLRESLQRIPTHVVLDVSEIPDRNSPDDQPEMMLVTGPELADIVAHRLNNALEGVS